MVASPFVCICCVLEMKTISLVLLVLYYFHLVTVKGFHIVCDEEPRLFGNEDINSTEFQNLTSLKQDYYQTDSSEELLITFRSQVHLLGLITQGINSEHLSLNLSIPNEIFNQIYFATSQKNLTWFDGAIQTDRVLLVINSTSKPRVDVLLKINFIGCDLFMNEDLPSFHLSAYHSSILIDDTDLSPHSKKQQKTFISVSTTSSHTQISSSINCKSTDNSADVSGTGDHTGIVIAIVLPVTVLLLLNILVFGFLFLFIMKKGRSQPKNLGETLHEVNNESLYEMSSSEEEEDKLKTTMGRHYPSIPEAAEYEIPINHQSTMRPGSLPFIQDTNDNYSEVIPCHLPSPYRSADMEIVTDEIIKNQLYDIEDHSEEQSLETISASCVQNNNHKGTPHDSMHSDKMNLKCQPVIDSPSQYNVHPSISERQKAIAPILKKRMGV